MKEGGKKCERKKTTALINKTVKNKSKREKINLNPKILFLRLSKGATQYYGRSPVMPLLFSRVPNSCLGSPQA